ncbi:MAG: tRNA lysidine(34) synthetase TilS [Bacteroidetes bacterium]|nr:tRNA lysidine(34) synthetase TilS [Bacteroidota bacterium]
MQDRFKCFIDENQLCGKHSTILLSVSGGMDSMVMTHLFILKEIPIAIAHCNFKLRGAESEENEAFVAKFAEENRIPYFIKSFDTKAYAKKHRISIQMAARELRVNWLEKLMEEHQFDSYATAHHLDDQIETFFINLFRGTGLTGIHGILPRQGKLIHPMLFAYRSELEDFAQQNNIPYSMDSSNLKTDYDRNKIRHDLIPMLVKMKPEIKKILTGNIENFRVAEAVYEQYIQKIKNQLVQTKADLWMIRIDKLMLLPNPTVYLFELIREFNFNFSQAKSIINSTGSVSGKQFYSLTHRLSMDREFLLVQSIKSPARVEFSIEKEEEVIHRPFIMELTKQTRSTSYTIPNDPNIAALDATQLKFPLIIRHWKEGDFFYPLGMKHKKLLSDFFIDQKLSIPQKENTWILESEGKIAWIVGHRIDERFKISKQTKQIIEFHLKG